MDDKPEFYTLAEVVDHLKDIVPPERIEIDIGRGLLRIGAALPPLAGCDHYSRELLERHGADMDEFDKSILRRVKRPRQVWLETGLAVAVLRSSEGAALREAEYPVFIEANGKTERYLVEHVEFPESTVVVRADLVVFSFDLWAYLYRLGKISDAKRDPPPKRNAGGSHMIGHHYSIKEQEALARMHASVKARYAASGRGPDVHAQRAKETIDAAFETSKKFDALFKGNDIDNLFHPASADRDKHMREVLAKIESSLNAYPIREPSGRDERSAEKQVPPGEPRSSDGVQGERQQEKRRQGRPKSGNALTDRLPELREAAIKAAMSIKPNRRSRETVADKLALHPDWDRYSDTTLRSHIKAEWWEK